MAADLTSAGVLLSWLCRQRTPTNSFFLAAHRKPLNQCQSIQTVASFGRVYPPMTVPLSSASSLVSARDQPMARPGPCSRRGSCRVMLSQTKHSRTAGAVVFAGTVPTLALIMAPVTSNGFMLPCQSGMPTTVAVMRPSVRIGIYSQVAPSVLALRATQPWFPLISGHES